MLRCWIWMEAVGFIQNCHTSNGHQRAAEGRSAEDNSQSGLDPCPGTARSSVLCPLVAVVALLGFTSTRFCR